MVPIGSGKSADPGSTPVKEDISDPARSGGVPATEDELLTPLQKRQLWVSSPELSFLNDLEADEEVGIVRDLYGSLLKDVGADLDSALTNPGDVLQRRNRRFRPLTVSVASNRLFSRLSDAISKGQADVRARLRPQPLPKDFRQASLPTTDDANDQDATYEEPGENLQQESSSNPSLAESVSSNNASSTAFERGSAANASYRRLVVPACPSMVTSDLVHVQSGKALIVVSGGTGYKCWNKNRQADSPSLEDTCLLLWKC